MYSSLLGGQRHNSVQEALSPMADLPARGTFSYRFKEKVEFVWVIPQSRAPWCGHLYWDSVGERKLSSNQEVSTVHGHGDNGLYWPI